MYIHVQGVRLKCACMSVYMVWIIQALITLAKFVEYLSLWILFITGAAAR